MFDALGLGAAHVLPKVQLHDSKPNLNGTSDAREAHNRRLGILRLRFCTRCAIGWAAVLVVILIILIVLAVIIVIIVREPTVGCFVICFVSRGARTFQPASGGKGRGSRYLLHEER